MPADAVAALNRPGALGHRPANRSMAAAPSRSVAKRPRSSTVSSRVITSTVTDRLCGSIPMTTRSGN
jgi:hypothetical protein